MVRTEKWQGQMSLQQLASGEGSLDIYYSSQFVQNEISNTVVGNTLVSEFLPFEHTPVLAGTVLGTIYLGVAPGGRDQSQGQAIQTFSVGSSGSFQFTDIGELTRRAVKGEINLVTGQMRLEWDFPPGPHYVMYSYEYNMDCTPPRDHTDEELEQYFVLMYHLKQSYQDVRAMSQQTRGWFVNRLVNQRQKEEEQMDKYRKSLRGSHLESNADIQRLLKGTTSHGTKEERNPNQQQPK